MGCQNELYSGSPFPVQRRMKMDINKIKKIAVIFLGCTAGSVLLQLAAPMILAALISAVSFAIPFLLYHVIVEKGWRIRLVTVHQNKQSEAAAGDGHGDKNGYEAAEEDGPVSAEARDDSVPSGQEEAAAFWYNNKGKIQLNRIISSLYSRGIYECWIRKDGICNFRSDRGYRRAGIFHDYPGACSGMLAKLMRNDGLNAVDQGKYLYIAWAEE